MVELAERAIRITSYELRSVQKFDHGKCMSDTVCEHYERLLSDIEDGSQVIDCSKLRSPRRLC